MAKPLATTPHERMMRLAVIVVLTGILAALFAYGLQPRDPRDLESEFRGKTMNDFEAPLFERYQAEFGETLRYTEYADKGTPLVVNFWASWCIPACYNEAPRLEAAWQKYQGQILMIGVNFQDELHDAEEFLDRFDKTYPAVRDPRGAVGIEWGVYGVPETYFIRGDGTLSYKHNGEISVETLETQIRALLE
jgi:cytochrome c biogenesis protein CcmG/thiol:disulfide interchange protein DsbE